MVPLSIVSVKGHPMKLVKKPERDHDASGKPRRPVYHRNSEIPNFPRKLDRRDMRPPRINRKPVYSRAVMAFASGRREA